MYMVFTSDITYLHLSYYIDEDMVDNFSDMNLCSKEIILFPINDNAEVETVKGKGLYIYRLSTSVYSVKV